MKINESNVSSLISFFKSSPFQVRSLMTLDELQAASIFIDSEFGFSSSQFLNQFFALSHYKGRKTYPDYQ